MKKYSLLLLLPCYIGLAYPIMKQSRLNHRTTENVPTICNNPGALRMSSNKKVTQYVSGYYQTEGNGMFMTFDMPQHGYFALQEVLNSYGESSIYSLMKRYAPSIENDTDKYLKDLCKELGVTPRTKVKECNQMALMSTIAKIEGFKE